MILYDTADLLAGPARTTNHLVSRAIHRHHHRHHLHRLLLRHIALHIGDYVGFVLHCNPSAGAPALQHRPPPPLTALHRFFPPHSFHLLLLSSGSASRFLLASFSIAELTRENTGPESLESGAGLVRSPTPLVDLRSNGGRLSTHPFCSLSPLAPSPPNPFTDPACLTASLVCAHG